jgi:FkbM family methyltransferase
MSALEGVETYFRLFGAHGVVLAAKARYLRRSIEVAVLVPDIKHPVHLRLRTSDVSVFRQVFITREYDSPFCLSPRIIVDAGANIGLTSVFYANRYPSATIIALEPESSNYRMLKTNTAPYANITAIRAALWKHNGEISLVDPDLRHYGFQTVETREIGTERKGKEIVPAMTLDTVMADLNIESIDILKMDIEGSEKDVFENSTAWIDRVETIVVEFHDQFRSGCARSVYLAAKDFEFERRRGETVFLAKREYMANELATRTD